MVRTISILGSTGSIGVNALEVISNLKNSFKVKYLSTNKNVDLLISQIKEHKPQTVAVVDELAAEKIKSALDEMGIELLIGKIGLLDLSQRHDIDLV
ncbi:MAG: 1-deoxy-D-xylulose-5-phosphate reductoisomerase, partial [Candidatus Neomarinimicrobiota bacterium]